VEKSVQGDAHRPDMAYDDTRKLNAALYQRVLPFVLRPGRYLGGELGADRRSWDSKRTNVLLAFPDAYELGISNTGLRILYAGLNAHPETYADIAFTPWPDMEDAMRREALPLFGLQTRRPARDFDIIGFSLGYELCYTNVLTMLDLAGIPLKAVDRTDGDPLIIGGGHCAANPTVMGPFFDVLCIGDGEDVVLEIADAVRKARDEGLDRSAMLALVYAIPGVWHPDKTERVEARVAADLNAYPIPANLVPVIESIHDRLSLEVMRGCTRGCRFCQAGMITRPVRERDTQMVIDSAMKGAGDLGWSELSLLSLSTCDYSGLQPVMSGILDQIKGTHTTLELPSLRVDALDSDIYTLISGERPTSFTFAPEAGSQRLRDVINKNVTEENILESVHRAFKTGAKKIKLYFMIGLPTETDQDLDELVDLVRRIVRIAPSGGSQVTVSISPFAPKAHTPFQWSGQISREEIQRRNSYLLHALRPTRAKVSLRSPEVSHLEALLGLGDASLADLVFKAWRLGARFDAWDEQFDASLWKEAVAACGVQPRDWLDAREVSKALPWDNVFARVDREFLEAEWDKAQNAQLTEDCRLEGGCEDCEACEPGLQHVFSLLGDPKPKESEPVVADVKTPAFDPRNALPGKPDREHDKWRKWRERAPGKCWYRMEYAKSGDVRFLGHLDFQRLLQMALRRSGLPVAYSQGFNQRPLFKFGPPLSLGVCGDHELLDIAFVKQVPDWEARLNEHLPDTVRVLGSEIIGPVVPESIDKSVDRHDYHVVIPTDGDDAPQRDVIERELREFLASEKRIHLRRRPKGDVEIDVRPLVSDTGLRIMPHSDGVSGIQLELSILREHGTPGLPVNEFLAAVFGASLPQSGICHITRTALLSRDGETDWRSPLIRVREINRRFWLRGHLSA
jgi:radical SAM family uncharacterized protein/radical SAM-linked protein